MSSPTIRIPATETRRSHDRNWAKVLQAVDDDATNGYGFHGPFVDRGSLVNLSDVTSHSRVLLECAGNDGSTKHPDYLYVLWVLDGQEWREVARATGKEWAFALREPAAALLRESQAEELSDDDLAECTVFANAIMDAVRRRVREADLSDAQRAKVRELISEHLWG